MLYKDVAVTSGSYKGLKGKVTEADDLYARIELHTKSKKIKVLKNNLNVIVHGQPVPYLRFIGAAPEFSQPTPPTYGSSSGGRSAWNGGMTPSVSAGNGGVSAWGGSRGGFGGDGGKTPAYGAGGASTWGGASAWGGGQEEALLGVVLKVQVPFGIEVKVEVQLQVATKVATPPGIEIREETPPGIEVREAVLPGKVEVLGKVVTILHGEVRKVIPVHGDVTDTKKCCFLTEVRSLVSSSLLSLFIYVDDYCFEFCISTYSFMYTTFFKKIPNIILIVFTTWTIMKNFVHKTSQLIQKSCEHFKHLYRELVIDSKVPCVSLA